MDKEPGMIDPTDETLDLKRRIHVQIPYCQHKQTANLQDEKWHLQEIALLQALATVNQTQVLEHGLHRLFDVLKLKATDVINAQVKGLLEEDPGGS